MLQLQKFLTGFAALILLWLLLTVVSPSIYAREGRVDTQNGNISCKGVSIWEKSQYRIVGRCQGLVYPYSEQLDTYMLWVRPEDGSSPVKVENVDEGLIDGHTTGRFSDIIISAEENINVREMGANVVISGSVQAFDFGTAENTLVPAAQTEVSKTETSPEPLYLGETITRGVNMAFRLLLVLVLVGVVLYLVAFRRRTMD